MQNNMKLLALLHILVVIEASRRRLAKDGPFIRPKIENEAEPPETQDDQFTDIIPVDITHVRKEGLADPSIGQKEPYDALAAAMGFRLPEKEMRRRIQEAKYKKKYPRKWNDPYNDEDKVEISHKPPAPFDFELLHAINIGIPEAYKANLVKTQSLFKTGMRSPDFNRTVPQAEGPNARQKKSYDPRDKLPVHPSEEMGNNPGNWTTCDEFAVGARFHPREVAGIVWELFYIWSYKGFPDHNRFEISYPTKKLVAAYKAYFDKRLNVKVDWKQPMLLLRTWMEFLLVAADRRGLFIAIPKTDVPEHAQNMTVPHLTVRMKIVEPYLGMMFCEETIGLLLAPKGEVPPVRQRATEAATLGFRGVGTVFLENEYEERMNLKMEQSEPPPVVKRKHAPKVKNSPFFNNDER